ncbi:MAG: hypothetical protein JOZ69_08660 [Myxococcales bacterium]|nr:hypothetical protein [Myxococcales bacterium]
MKRSTIATCSRAALVMAGPWLAGACASSTEGSGTGPSGGTSSSGSPAGGPTSSSGAGPGSQAGSSGAGSSSGSGPSAGSTSGGSGGASTSSSGSGSTGRSRADAGSDSGPTAVGPKPAGDAGGGDITIDPKTTYQTMDGFGEADVWQSQTSSSAAQRTLLFDPVNGVGLTLLRIGIDGSTGKIMGDAAFVDGPAIAKFGGKVWAAPWSPPAAAKDNNNVNNGGHLLTSAYDSWSSTLAAFPAYYKQQTGVDLFAISAQNEPDFTASYQSCLYSSAQMNAFIKVLGPKLAALNPPVSVLAAEPDVWSNLWAGDGYGTGIVNDATVGSFVSVIATHDYGSGSSFTRPAPPATMTQHLWETEVTYSSGATITAGLDVARGIYAAVTTGGANGWLYWWTQALFDGGSTASPPKRVFALGNFSKFVRPGYVRVAATGVPSAIHVVPFTNPADGTLAIVAINTGTTAQPASFVVSGTSWPATVTPNVTSATADLAAGTPISLSAGRFSASLDPQSVTTFVGKP